MDELESIMGQRAGAPGSEHEGSLRMKTELLVQMDGLAKSGDLVFVLAASNLPWELDYGMLRRLEKRILVDLPVKSARSAMFAHHLPQTLSQHPLRITTQIDYDQAAEVGPLLNSHADSICIAHGSKPHGRFCH
jgi:katanin p60 ATPase-containing subunit A1